MRPILVTSFAVSTLLACGPKSAGDDSGDDDDDGPDACVGIECNVVNCNAMSLPATSISGTVFAPNGTLPLNGVNVYVPRDPLPAFVEGATCERCATSLPGFPIAQAISDAAGNFRVDNVPAGANVPLVITTGKWRRQITISNVNQCTDNPTSTADTRLPKNKAEGDIPKIAIATGFADTMECLARKLGIDDAEITSASGAGRIQLFAGNGVASFANGGGNLTSVQTLWNSVDTLKTYDVVILSCEGVQLGDNGPAPDASPKSQDALNAMKQYADLGGRVFASHWHNIWIGGRFQNGNTPTQPAWAPVATWSANTIAPGNPIFIDEVTNPKGTLFADWMVTVGGSTTRGQFNLVNEPTTPPQTSGRRTALAMDTTQAERWVRAAGNEAQMFQFTTPLEVLPDQRCGKVVFTDMHVSGQTDNEDQPYPNNCVGGAGNLDLTPQEKALAFMFFDIASCVGGIF